MTVIQRLIGLFTILLLTSTWGMWCLPASSSNPQIPWFSLLCAVPAWVDLALLAGLGLSSFLLIGERSQSRRRWYVQAIYLFCFIGLVLLDQHRLQPWALQFLLVATVLSISPDRVGLKCCRWIVVSIYVYSAVSKFDYAFLTGHGQLLLNGLLKPFSIDNSFWSERTCLVIVSLFPIGEFITALLLLSHRFYRLGVISSCVMHVTLLITLGPLGLDHENGVLLWNVYFIFQNVILFWNTASPSMEPVELRATNRLAYLLTGLMLVLPILENWGWYDHWPAWAVYSPRPERVRVLVDQNAVDRFPKHLQSLCGQPAPFEERVPILLDRWAFQTRHCPIYPQLRYRLALASALLDAQMANNEIAVEIGLTPNRMTGERETITLTDKVAVDEFLLNYQVNTSSRKISVQLK